ncbi:HPF/RaiA family ribosome-associated protein [Photobacterium rosenbergii]|uniref:HPF/RaiA family ribosome-associated protein n=1 Tax=Photobacterium rosenbergii TaxID=294936 RepID=UPI001C993AA0|nr:HPF/RaiA family ribosome-associated protein [Photobacterium rosenbergii]MBY5946689.1 HPF/RaiA family ribosome-associated protein [Photobacterium rosenbergii]
MHITNNNISITDSMKASIVYQSGKLMNKFQLANDLKVHVALDRKTKEITVEASSPDFFSKQKGINFQLACNRCFKGLAHQAEKQKTQLIAARHQADLPMDAEVEISEEEQQNDFNYGMLAAEHVVY